MSDAQLSEFLDEIEALTGARPTTVVAGRLSLLATDPEARDEWERAGVNVFIDQTRDRFLSTMSPSEIDGEG